LIFFSMFKSVRLF